MLLRCNDYQLACRMRRVVLTTILSVPLLMTIVSSP